MLDDTTVGDAVPGGDGNGAEELDLTWFTPEQEGGTSRLEHEMVLGRDASCGIRIPSSATSREHARIARRGTQWTIHDASSKNGVYVDGQRVQSSDLRLGMVLRVGGAVGVVTSPLQDGEMEFTQLAQGLWGGRHLAAVASRGRLSAKSGLNIVLEAESGSGKELFARAIHGWSERSGALVALNCAALPTGLAEAELFGYQRGAFTGAERAHDGYFRSASRGTLFLDEILELPIELQAKLLRAIERHEVVPLGMTTPVPADARIVVAAQVPLAQAVRNRRLRPDLFARLNGVTIQIPPLRRRREDILPLFVRLLRNHTASPPALEPAAAEALCLHDWPLNVRELETVAQRLVALHPAETRIGTKQLTALLGDASQSSPPEAEESSDSDAAWQNLLNALVAQKGNIVRAAEALGISRQRAHRMIARHPGFDVSSLRRVSRCN